MKELVLLFEEPSACEMMRCTVSRMMLNDIIVQYISFNGKQDLERNVERKIRCYQNPDARFLVVRDQDSGDCIRIKQKLLELCAQSGKSKCKVRIMCHELETVYLADLHAVENGLNVTNLARRQNEHMFRTPDTIPSPKERLKDITKQKYKEIAGSRAISPFLDLGNTRSKSFKNLLKAIHELADMD